MSADQFTAGQRVEVEVYRGKLEGIVANIDGDWVIFTVSGVDVAPGGGSFDVGAVHTVHYNQVSAKVAPKYEISTTECVANAKRIEALLELRDSAGGKVRDEILDELYAFHEKLMELTGEQLTWSQLPDGWRKYGRKLVDDVIGNGFPDGTLDVFYSERTGLAIVEASDYQFYRVWPDGEGTQVLGKVQ